MKREHKTEIGGRTLTLSLSFGTSLKLLDEVGSPSAIVEDFIRGYTAERKGQEHAARFELNERNAVQILHIGNADYEGLSFDEMGELVMEDGIVVAYQKVFAYLNDLVLGRSKEADKGAEVASGEK